MWKIYKITCLVNNKVYIGQTKQKRLSARIGKHQSDARLGSDDALHRAIRKYGIANFKVDEIFSDLDSQEKADLYEREMIKGLNTLVPSGYNLTSGGRNFEVHRITKKKISKTVKQICKKHKITIIDREIGISFNSIYEAADYLKTNPARIHVALKRPDRFYRGVYILDTDEYETFIPKGIIRNKCKPFLAKCSKTGTEYAFLYQHQVTKIGASKNCIPRCLRTPTRMSGGHTFRSITLKEYLEHPNKS